MAEELLKQHLKSKENNARLANIPIDLNGSSYSRMDQVKFVENSLWNIWTDMVCVGRPYHVKYFKGCLPQILLGSFMNTLIQMSLLFQVHILKNLKVKDLGRVARVSKKAYKATESEELWKCFLYKELGKHYGRTFQELVPYPVVGLGTPFA